MNRNQIISELYVSKDIADIIRKHDGGAGNEDLKSELFVALLNTDENKLIEMYRKGELIYFAAGIVRRMIFQTGSKFHRTYRKCFHEYTDALLNEKDESDIEIKIERDKKVKQVHEIYQSELDFCEQAVLTAYLKEGGVTNGSKATGLPMRSFHKILNTAKQKMKTGVNGKLQGNYAVLTVDVLIDCESDLTPENINEMIDEFADYMRLKLEKKTIPTKRQPKNTNIVKEIKPVKLKQII